MHLYTLSSMLLLALFSGAVLPAAAQDDGPPKYEFRGAWIATVLRLDWPKSSGTEAQQEELRTMLDALKEAGINAVFFQVRSEADAMYDSEIEPWSYWLTGQQGKAPDPFYDPLQFAIEEAHERGMELHAWFNPYRAARGSGYVQSADHVIVQRPEWILSFGDLRVLNPGIPEVRDYVTDVIMDVVGRYDVDGVHFDDYFYPYPPNQITDQDSETFQQYGQWFSDIGEWRRDNVNVLIEQVQERIREVKPEVVFGISPFGIWKNGVPSGIVGLDAYNVIYADAVTWLDQQWIDYLTPQLYWAFGGGQDYGKLAPWWAEQAARNDRHLYPGHGLYRSESATFSGSLFAASEVPRQVRFNRQHDDIQGSVFFRAQNITQYHSKGFADSLETDLYRYPALTPIMEWHSLEPPPPPEQLAFEWTGEDEVTLSWTPPTPAKAAASEAEFFAVYRVRAGMQPDFAVAMADARNLVALTGETSITDRPGIAGDPYFYAVTSVSPNSVESPPSNVVSLEGRATAVELPQEAIAAFHLQQNYPNPFRGRTEIAFVLKEPGVATLRVYNLLGQEVTTLVSGDAIAPGTYSVEWDGVDQAGSPVATGTYLYVLEVGGVRKTKAMVLVR